MSIINKMNPELLQLRSMNDLEIRMQHLQTLVVLSIQVYETMKTEWQIRVMNFFLIMLVQVIPITEPI